MFDKLLIANRGEIALRVLRACKELGIATVAVYSEADAAAYHVREADEAMLIGGAAPSESYLRADRIIEAARQIGASRSRRTVWLGNINATLAAPAKGTTARARASPSTSSPMSANRLPECAVAVRLWRACAYWSSLGWMVPAA